MVSIQQLQGFLVDRVKKDIALAVSIGGALLSTVKVQNKPNKIVDLKKNAAILKSLLHEVKRSSADLILDTHPNINVTSALAKKLRADSSHFDQTISDSKRQISDFNVDLFDKKLTKLFEISVKNIQALSLDKLKRIPQNEFLYKALVLLAYYYKFGTFPNSQNLPEGNSRANEFGYTSRSLFEILKNRNGLHLSEAAIKKACKILGLDFNKYKPTPLKPGQSLTAIKNQFRESMSKIMGQANSLVKKIQTSSTTCVTGSVV